MRRKWIFAGIGSFFVTLLFFLTIILPAIDPRYNILNVFKKENIQEKEEPLSPLETVWYNPSWTYRKLLTLDTTKITNTRLVNFPILVNITDADLASHAQSDGDDIFFVLYSDNTTKLNHEIEYYKNSTGQLFAWVNITAISRTLNTKIWMYYGNNGCGSQQNPAGTWNGNYVGVWHLNETSGTQYDSTSNNNDGTPSVTTQGKAGFISGADTFDGSNDYVNCGNAASLNVTTAITLEAWSYNHNLSSTANARIWDRYPSPTIYIRRAGTPKNGLSWYGMIGATALDEQLGTTIVPVNSWHHAVLSYANDATHALKAYVDGKYITQDTAYSGALSATNVKGYIGNRASDIARPWDGLIDEFRISKVQWNNSWINMTYNVTKYSGTFISEGGELSCSWQNVPTAIGGTIYNNSEWTMFSDTINGSIFNTSGFHIISNSINGSVFNSTIWHVIDSSLNGSLFNQSSWHSFSVDMNGSVYNVSGIWRIFSDTINGSIFNISTSVWHIVNDSVNGSIFNASDVWHVLDNTVNGSIYNISLLWRIIDDTIDGNIYNTSSWVVFSSSLNGSIFNTSSTGGSPFNVNLYVHNPNPGNGTHSTNYLQANTSGLTTSVDVVYQNFTTPATSIPTTAGNLTFNDTEMLINSIYNSSNIYATAWGSASGILATWDIYVGQMKVGPDYVIYRGMLIFNTSGIPDDAIIDSAKVVLYGAVDMSVQDFNVTLQQAKPPYPHDPLIITDYDRHSYAGDRGHTNTSGFIADDYFNITVNAIGLTDINLTGLTKWGLRSDQDINADPCLVSEIVGLHGNWTPGYLPYLEVTWHAPVDAWHHIVNLTFYTNESGAWVAYNTTFATSNGTVTVPAPVFDGVSTYFWNCSWDSNHTNYGNSSVYQFETVLAGSGGMVVLSGANRSLVFSIISIGFISCLVTPFVLKRRRRQG